MQEIDSEVTTYSGKKMMNNPTIKEISQFKLKGPLEIRVFYYMLINLHGKGL